MAYLLTDNNTAVDTIARFGTSTLMPITEMLQSKLEYTIYSTWALNISYGGAVAAIAENEIDLFLGIIGLSTDREPYYTTIIQIFKFE